MKTTLALLLGLLSLPLQSQEINPSLLLCEGKWSNFPRNIQDVPITSGIVRLERNAIYLSGIPGFSSSETLYTITKFDAGSISFESAMDARFVGGLNRLNGELFLKKDAIGNPPSLEMLMVGKCRVQQRLF